MMYKSIFINFSNTKFPGIINFFNTQHRNRRIDDLLNIIVGNGIAQYDDHFIVSHQFPW